MNGYAELATFYDRLMTVDYGAKAAYWLELFDRYGKRPQTLLDIACGSGNLTAPLAANGIGMIGLDLSADMLALAAEKLPDTLFLQQDMREMELGTTVSGAVCALDSINHLRRTADVKAVFASAARAIEKGGLFVFDVNTPYKHSAVLGDNAFVFEEEDFTCVWQNRLFENTMEVDMWLDFFVECPDGRYERLSDHVRERAYSERTLRKLLGETGFSVLAVLDEATDAPPTATTERWVIVAQKV